MREMNERMKVNYSSNGICIPQGSDSGRVLFSFYTIPVGSAAHLIVSYLHGA